MYTYSSMRFRMVNDIKQWICLTQLLNTHHVFKA